MWTNRVLMCGIDILLCLWAVYLFFFYFDIFFARKRKRYLSVIGITLFVIWQFGITTIISFPAYINIAVTIMFTFLAVMMTYEGRWWNKGVFVITFNAIWMLMETLCNYILLAIYLHTIPEFLVSTGVFMFLRTYAGGVHLNSFKACFICSVTVQVMILQINNKYPLELFVAWGIILVSSICIWKLSPVENINHELKKEEKEHCRKVTGKILGAIFIAAGCCTALGMKKYLSLIALTALTVFISQCIGIIKYKVEKEKN